MPQHAEITQDLLVRRKAWQQAGGLTPHQTIGRNSHISLAPADGLGASRCMQAAMVDETGVAPRNQPRGGRGGHAGAAAGKPESSDERLCWCSRGAWCRSCFRRKQFQEEGSHSVTVASRGPQASPECSMALRMTRSFRMHAVSTTFGGLPLARSLAANARTTGLCLLALSAAM